MPAYAPRAMLGALLLVAGRALGEDAAAEAGVAPGAPSPAAREGPPTLPSRPFSWAIVGAVDQGGPSIGLRGGLGLPLNGQLRIDLVATVTGGTTKALGTPATLWRLGTEARLGWRSGRLLPWLGAGWQGSHLIDDREAVCEPLLDTCLEVAPSEYAVSRRGPLVAAGVLLALDARVVLGVELRQAFLASSRAGAPGDGAFGGTGLLCSIGF